MQFVAEIRRLLQRRLHAGADASLDETAAARLWGAILDGALDELELGAVMAALAVGGETPDELAGFHRATRERVPRWPAQVPPHAVAMAAYGLVPGEAVIVALAAALLRRFQVPVVLHGILDSPCGVSVACVLRELGLMPCASLAQAEDALLRDGIAFVPVQLLSPALGALVALRGRLGVENSAHLVARALDPLGRGSTRIGLSIAGHVSERHDALAKRLEGDFVSLRWPPGRTPLNLSLRPRIERIHDGTEELLFEADSQETRSAQQLPPDDAPGIASWVQRIATGAMPVPVPATSLVAACLYAVGRAADLSQAKAAAALNAGRVAA